MNISIIIPNFNGEHVLKKNLPHVLDAATRYKKGKIEIIIPDDPSTDNSAEVITRFIRSIKQKHIIGKTISNRDPSQGGFSKNVNRGVSLATGDILVLLNSDVSPRKDFLEPLIAHFEIDSDLFAVGCMDESVEEGKIVLRGRALGKWQRGFLMHRAGNVDGTNTMWVSGGSGAFRKSIWDELGGLNELFNPFYWEDIDLCYRALKSGYRILFEKKSVVVHAHEEGAIKKHYSSYNKLKIVYRNQFTFIWINITDKNLLVSHIFWLPYHLIRAIISKDRALLWGFWHALLRFSEISLYKNTMSKKFIMTDRQIMETFKN